MALVSVTRLHLRGYRHFPAFLVYTLASARQVRRADGFVTGLLARDVEGGSWTITVWRDEAAMRAYRNSGAHMRAMPKLLNWCDEASFVHWPQDHATLPTGEVALQRLRSSSARLSKVRHPSKRHQAGQAAGEHLPKPGLTLLPKRS